MAASQGVAALAMLLIAAVLSRLLEEARYASYRQSILTFQVVAPLLALGLPQALLFFYPREPGSERRIFSQFLVVLLVIGAAVGLIYALGGNVLIAQGFENPDLVRGLRIFAPYALFALPLMLVGPCLTTKGKVFELALFSLVGRSVMVVAVIGLVWHYQNPFAGIAGLVGATALMAVAGVGLCWWASTGGGPGLDMKQALSYSVPLGIASALGVFTLGLDKLIVSAMLPVETFAVYVNGAIEVPLIGIVTGSAAAVMMPEISKLYQEGRCREIIGLFGRAAIKSSLVLYPCMVVLFVLAPELMVFVYSDKYLESSVPFRVYLCLLPLRVVLYGAVLQGAGKSRLVLTSSVIALVTNGVLSAVLVYFFGYVGAAVGTVVTVALVLVPYLLRQISKITETPVSGVLPYGALSFRFFLCVLCALPLVGVLAWIGDGLLPVWRLAVGSSVYGVTYLVVFHVCGYLRIGDVIAQARKVFKARTSG